MLTKTKLPKAIICDLDGTLALHHHRNPYDTAKCMNDKPNPPVVYLLDSLKSEFKILIISGREEQFRSLSEAWLAKHCIHFDKLWLRPNQDLRKDSVIKKEIFIERIAPFYDVFLVLDDRNQVVEMWREIGLTCFQVAEGNF